MSGKVLAGEEELTQPFQRHDKYGTLGMGPMSTGEKIRLALLAVTVLPIKLVGAMTALLSFWLCCRLSFLLPASVRNDVVARLGNWHCRACLWWLGFWRVTWIKVGEQQQQRQGRGGKAGGKAGGRGGGKAARSSGPAEGAAAVGIVSNHISWCDILLHMSRSFPAFVARSQTRRMPIVGIISYMMGCLYVDREASARKRGSASGAPSADSGSTNGSAGSDSDAAGAQPRVSDAVRRRMDDVATGRLPGARPLLLFPEGTTTNGRFLLPFKTGAFLAGQPLQPVVIRYGEDRVSPAWEMIPAARHLFLMLCNPVHSVTAFELPVYHPSEEERRDPRLYAANVRKLMLDFSGLQSTSATYTDKMAYMQRLKQEYGLS